MLASSRLQTSIDRVLFGGLLVGAWYLAAARTGVQWTSSPHLVLLRIWADLTSGKTAFHAQYTLLSAALGFAIGAVPGAVLPLILRRSPLLLSVIDPFLVAAYGLPKAALIPLFIIWFGIGIWSKVALVVSVSFFLVFFSMLEGVRAVDPKLVRMAEIAGASERQVALTVILPSTLPYLFSAVGVTLPLSIGGAAICEIISSNRGLGYLIQSSAMDFDATGSIAAIVTLAVLVAITNFLSDLAHARIVAWDRSEETR